MLLLCWAVPVRLVVGIVHHQSAGKRGVVGERQTVQQGDAWSGDRWRRQLAAWKGCIS